MTPKGRERAYEKRRYEEWQARLAVKRARRRRQQQYLAAVLGAILTVAVIVIVVLVVNGKHDDKSPAVAASPPASPAATPAASAAAKAGACPADTLKAPAKPLQFSKAPPASDAQGKTWKLTLNTTCGAIAINLDGAKAPHAVSVMLKLAKAGYFNDTPCHRLTTSGIYVLQCGDPTGTGTGTPGFTFGPVENAPANSVYPAGTVAMARGGNDGNSMGSQFFLVYKDSTIGTDSAGGYTVFGTMTKGLDVVTKVAAAGSDNSTGSGDGHPVSAVSIASTTVSAG